MAKGEALQSGLVKEIKIDLSHVNRNGVDFAHVTINDTFRVVEAKSSVYQVEYDTIKGFVNRTFDSQGNPVYNFKTQEFLDDVQKNHGIDMKLDIQNAINDGQFEYEIFINSPQGITQELMNLNGQIVNNVKIIIANVWR